MEEVVKDVKPDSSPDTVVEGAPAVVEESTPQAPAQEEAVVEPSTQDVKPEVIKDNRPIDNVAWEAKRKVDELLPKVDEILKHIQQGGQQQPKEPEYTKAQLLTYASAPDTTIQQRMWAYGEVEKMDKADRQKELQEIIRSTQEKTEGENRRAQGAQWVATAFPDTVIKDNLGNPVGWNQGHPVLMRANEYISRNRNLQSDPEGFVAAVKMAAFDLGVSMNKQVQTKLDRTTGQLRKEQKKALVSSTGTRPVENAELAAKKKLATLQQNYNDLHKAGKHDEASKVFNEIVKQKGLNPFFNL